MLSYILQNVWYANSPLYIEYYTVTVNYSGTGTGSVTDVELTDGQFGGNTSLQDLIGKTQTFQVVVFGGNEFHVITKGGTAVSAYFKYYTSSDSAGGNGTFEKA